MKTLKDLNLVNTRVILRCDFNDIFDRSGKIADDFRIKKVLPTLQHLLASNAKIVIIGSAQKIFNDNSLLSEQEIAKIFDFSVIATYLSNVLQRPVKYLNDITVANVSSDVLTMQPKDIILLGNFVLQIKEIEKNMEFAQKIALTAEVFVNEAFSLSHSDYATICHLPKLLPSVPGLAFEKELEELSKVTLNPKKPLVAIMGGTNLAARIDAIERLTKIADHVLIGGDIANVVLAAKKISMGKFIMDPFLENISKKVNLTDLNIHLPIDGVVSLNTIDDGYMHISAIGKVRKEEQCYDIGPETINLFSDIIKTANTIFWSGSMGMFEREKFANGTLEIAKVIAQSNAIKIAAGRKTIAFLKLHNLIDKFSFVSAGELSALKFLAGQRLEGVEALE